MNHMIGLVFLLGCFSGPVFGATWGVTELTDAADSALGQLKSDEGQAAYDAVSGYSIERNTAGNAAKAKISYVVNGKSKVASYFCHEHGGTIDCH